MRNIFNDCWIPLSDATFSVGQTVQVLGCSWDWKWSWSKKRIMAIVDEMIIVGGNEAVSPSLVRPIRRRAAK